MTSKELRELDIWISEHVMRRPIHRTEDYGGKQWESYTRPKNYTTDPTAAMEVLKRCVERCATVQVYQGSVWWEVSNCAREIKGAEETLELAICLFAKKLFSGHE